MTARFIGQLTCQASKEHDLGDKRAAGRVLCAVCTDAFFTVDCNNFMRYSRFNHSRHEAALGVERAHKSTRARKIVRFRYLRGFDEGQEPRETVRSGGKGTFVDRAKGLDKIISSVSTTQPNGQKSDPPPRPTELLDIYLAEG